MGADGNLVASDSEAFVETILANVRRETGIDFRGYRRGTIHRRIGNRMVAAGLTEPDRYLDLLLRDPAEAWRLLDRLTIKVSGFLRDRPVFESLSAELAELAERTERPLRIWSAGCANGEEAYSLAYLLLRTGVSGQIVATDVDPCALERARRGRYGVDAVSGFNSAELQVCFQHSPHPDGDFLIHGTLREMVVFQRHDLTCGHAPEPECFDVVCCRNVLIYLSPSMQQQVMTTLAEAMIHKGCLCLGEAEWPALALSDRFDVQSRHLKIFRKNA